MYKPGGADTAFPFKKDVLFKSVEITIWVPSSDSTREIDFTQYIDNGILVGVSLQDFRVSYTGEITGFKLTQNGNKATLRTISNDWGNSDKLKFSLWYTT